MIKAPELTHKAIYEALKAGRFYASTGAEIKELYVEDGILHIETSPATRVHLTTAGRQAKIVYPETDQTELTHAAFDLSDVIPGYVRLTVTDKEGHYAWTQPVWGKFSGKR